MTEALQDEKFYLRPGVKLEPLVDRWHAWPHLLAPLQQAMNLANRYLPTARSFVNSAQVHLSASKDPKMFGGPFVALPADAVPAVQSYIRQTELRRADALKLVADYGAFERSLSAASGYSLDGYYSEMPEPLRGMASLVYDVNDKPKIRFLEEMFAEDDYGHGAAQEIMIHDEGDLEREFFLSTPRLERTGRLFVAREFGSDFAKLLARARTRPISLTSAAALGGVAPDDLAPYFTCEAPRALARRFEGPGVRVRYFGHACLLIESADTCILVDPSAAYDDLGSPPHFKLADLPERIDILVITHGHQDHLVPEILMQLSERTDLVLAPKNNRGEIADPSLKRMLQVLGFRNIQTLETLEQHPFRDGVVTSLPFSGEHCDLDIHAKQCVLIELRSKRILLLVDSDAIDPQVYARLTSRLGDLDLMFVGMECNGAPLSWLYGPLLARPPSRRNDESRRLSATDSGRAWALVERLRPRHVAIYAMGQEPWMRYLMGLNYEPESVQLREADTFLSLCRSAGIPSEYLQFQRELLMT